MRRQRSLMLLAVAALAGSLALAPGAGASDGGASWHVEQPPPPPPPPGVAPVPYPVGLGPIGDIEFWAPNRGLLITAGTDAVPMGLYAYDGVSWHQLSTVCGGTDGRIAWAGPDEFWTIADQRPGQNVAPGSPQLADVSVCHFRDGQVVASYAKPLNQPDSYLPMHAAECLAPDDCWFAGDPEPAPATGAFHLHWNGHSLDTVISPQGREVDALAAYQGQLFESVKVAPDDRLTDPEPAARPSLLHLITPGASEPFVDIASGVTYPSGTQATDYDALRPSSDGTQLWAVAGAPGSVAKGQIALRLQTASGAACAYGTSGCAFRQLPLDTSQLQSGDAFPDAAAEPGASAAWVTVASPAEAGVNNASARVARITADGHVSEFDTLPTPSDPYGPKGAADKIACPAPHECWMSTTQGWLLHLTDGTKHPQDTDPNFAGVITYRPPDGGTAQVPPDEPPVDNSLLNQPPAPDQSTAGVAGTATTSPTPAGPLVVKFHSHVIHRTTLVVSFTLTDSARVQLLARRGTRVVAKTRPATLRPGRHKLRLRLNPRRWPTKIDFQVHRLVATTSSVGGPIH